MFGIIFAIFLIIGSLFVIFVLILDMIPTEDDMITNLIQQLIDDSLDEECGESWRWVLYEEFDDEDDMIYIPIMD
jgi:hypothetical protein